MSLRGARRRLPRPPLTSPPRSPLSPWCGHCKKLAPTWDALAEETLKTSSGKAVHFVSVDCTAKEGQSLCTDAGVKGYPTILTYGGADGPAGKYNGGREADALRAYATSQ